MKTLAELPHAKLIRFENGKMRLTNYGNLFVEFYGNGKREMSCPVSKQDLEDVTFNGVIDLQYLISFKRNELK